MRCAALWTGVCDLGQRTVVVLAIGPMSCQRVAHGDAVAGVRLQWEERESARAREELGGRATLCLKQHCVSSMPRSTVRPAAPRPRPWRTSWLWTAMSSC